MSFTNAFQTNAFQNSAFQIVDLGAVDTTRQAGAGAGGIGGTFTRRQWHTIIGDVQHERRIRLEAKKRKEHREDEKVRIAVQLATAQRLAEIVKQENLGRALARQTTLDHAAQLQARQQAMQQMLVEHLQSQQIAKAAQEQQEDEEAFNLLARLH